MTAPSLPVRTEHRQVTGVVSKPASVTVYKGIRYAASTAA